MQLKRRLSLSASGGTSNHPPSKRIRRRDILSTLSDELLVRILSHLTSHELLESVSLVSRRLHRLAADSQLWRAHYYSRFVLPRALRIPGFRVSNGGAGQAGGAGASSHRLHYSARKAVWADGGWGRRGGLVDAKSSGAQDVAERVDWKKQYKLRHNWAQGKCAVEEVSVRDASLGAAGHKTLVKVVEGIAVTADSTSGLRAWDLRTRQPLAQIDLVKKEDQDDVQPSCLAIDEQSLTIDLMDITIGFSDGAFGIWQLNLGEQEFTERYRHEKSCNGELIAVAYVYPYALTATNAGLISLYSFNQPAAGQSEVHSQDLRTEDCEHNVTKLSQTATRKLSDLPSPYLLTSLKSHTTRPPLAVSIRKMASSFSASIAYTFDSRDGWCIGIQDIPIRPPSSTEAGSEVLPSRLAYTLPIKTGNTTSPSSPQPSPARPRRSSTSSTSSTNDSQDDDGPTTLCYSHPYLLATLPDNTLILHLCTSTSTSLSISPGMRLWGHTSGISDAEITPRGKAVSVSTRGDEIRVWELEGRVGGSSIEVRPRQQSDDADTGEQETFESKSNKIGLTPPAWEDRRNWVGFDDEMVIVLKEARDGRESLMVYDFT